MINANELRIGNYVKFTTEDKSFVSQIYQFNDGLTKVTSGTYSASIGYPYKGVSVEPIPLTEDWHNKFGVIKDGFNQFEYKYAVGKSIIFTGDYVYLLNTNSINGERSLSDHICTLWNKDIERRDMYVHEWQNLYFALTGEELTINL